MNYLQSYFWVNFKQGTTLILNKVVFESTLKVV